MILGPRYGQIYTQWVGAFKKKHFFYWLNTALGLFCLIESNVGRKMFWVLIYLCNFDRDIAGRHKDTQAVRDRIIRTEGQNCNRMDKQ